MPDCLSERWLPRKKQSPCFCGLLDGAAVLPPTHLCCHCQSQLQETQKPLQASGAPQPPSAHIPPGAHQDSQTPSEGTELLFFWMGANLLTTPRQKPKLSIFVRARGSEGSRQSLCMESAPECAMPLAFLTKYHGKGCTVTPTTLEITGQSSFFKCKVSDNCLRIQPGILNQKGVPAQFSRGMKRISCSVVHSTHFS